MIADKGYASAVEFKMDMPDSWDKYDRNVKVANEAIGGDILEAVLAGINYKDEKSREQFLQLISWFPGICGQKNENAQMSLIEACESDFIGLMMYNLVGRGTKAQFEASKNADMKERKVMWMQSAFTMPADKNCQDVVMR